MDSVSRLQLAARVTYYVGWIALLRRIGALRCGKKHVPRYGSDEAEPVRDQRNAFRD